MNTRLPLHSLEWFVSFFQQKSSFLVSPQLQRTHKDDVNSFVPSVCHQPLLFVLFFSLAVWWGHLSKHAWIFHVS